MPLRQWEGLLNNETKLIVEHVVLHKEKYEESETFRGLTLLQEEIQQFFLLE